MTVNPESWMKDMWDVISKRPLRDLVLPGSHDAGMYHLSRIFGEAPEVWPEFLRQILTSKCNTRTQEVEIAEQLMQGSRHFELRPTIFVDSNSDEEIWFLSHGSRFEFLGNRVYVGALGERLDHVLKNVSAFADKHEKELVILRFSHYSYMHLYGKEVIAIADFNQQQKIQLLDLIKSILGERMIRSSDPFIRLADCTPEQLLGKTEGRVLCVFEDMSSLASPEDGIFLRGGEGGNNQSAKFAPSLVVGSGGRLKCAFVPREGGAEDIKFVRSLDGDNKWSRANTIGGQRSKKRPSLAVGPHGELYVLFVADNESNSLLVAKSEDDGVTWDANFPAGPFTDTDPSLAVGKDGTLYALFAEKHELWLTTLKPGGGNWSQPQKLSQATQMGPSLAIDGHGTLYALFVANNKTNDLLLTTSKDGGANWSPQQEVHQATNMPPSLAIDAQGMLYVIFSANTNENKLLLTTSKDGGANWSPQQEANQATNMPPSLAIDGQGKLYALYVAKNETNSILLTTSEGSGKGWSGGTAITAFANYAAEGYNANSHDTQSVIDFQKMKFKDFTVREGVLSELSWHGTWHPPLVDGHRGLPIDDCLDVMAKVLTERLKPSMEEWVNEEVIKQGKRPGTIWVDYYNARIIEAIEYLNRL